MGVRLHTHGDPDEDILDHAESAGDLIETFDLDHGVEHHVLHARGDREFELVRRFVVAVQGDPIGRETRTQRHRQLAGRTHIERETL